MVSTKKIQIIHKTKQKQFAVNQTQKIRALQRERRIKKVKDTKNNYKDGGSKYFLIGNYFTHKWIKFSNQKTRDCQKLDKRKP